MLFIEFQTNLHCGLNVVRYRNIDDNNWNYLYMDIETLNLLLLNYGVISTHRTPEVFTNCDNPTTSKNINLKYGGADISMVCRNGNDARVYLTYLEQIF